MSARLRVLRARIAKHIIEIAWTGEASERVICLSRVSSFAQLVLEIIERMCLDRSDEQ